MKQDFWGSNTRSLYGKLFSTRKDYQAYGDHEWNVPKHDDRQLFEMLSLGVFAAGLTFNAAFSRRKAFRQVFHNWNLEQIAKMNEKRDPASGQK